VDVSCKMV